MPVFSSARRLSFFIPFFITSFISQNFAIEPPAVEDPVAEMTEILSLPREDEVAAMDHLIEVTEKQAKIQKELRILMVQFKEHQEVFFKGEQTKQRAYQMVMTASQILAMISEHHMQHLFASEYLQELAMCSSIAGKSKPTRP